MAAAGLALTGVAGNISPDSLTPTCEPSGFRELYSSGNYLAEFTNNGIYVFKGGALQQGYPESQLQFWCSTAFNPGDGTCSSTSTTPIYDTQISYDWHDARWLVAALWGPSQSHMGEWLFVGASQSASPEGSFNIHAYPACTDFANISGDQPTMAYSHAYNGAQGRLVIDVQCFNPTGTWAGDEIWDIQLNQLLNGASAPAAQHFAESVYAMRPVSHLGAGNAIILSSLEDAPNNPPSEILAPTLTLWKLVPSSAGVASDSAPALVASLSSPGPIAGNPAPLFPLECADSSSCLVKLNLLDSDDGAVVNNSNGDNIFATSFSAAIPNSTTSEYNVFAYNLATGAYSSAQEGFAAAQVSYSTATIDDDDELVVNWTQFPNGSPPTTAPTSGVDLYQLRPIGQLNSDYVNGWPLAGSEPPYANTANGPCLGGTACRWGDYSANVYDPSCAAVTAGQTSECDLFWQVTEYTTNTSSDQTYENSNVTALYDPVLSGGNEGGTISFEGNQNVETECPGSPCGITFSVPAGTQPGDLVLVALSATDATGYLPSLPSGWTALEFKNQGYSQNFTSYDAYGAKETGWLLAHTYGYGDSGQYSFAEDVSVVGDEVGGELLVYRGVDTKSLNFSAWGFGDSGFDSQTVTVGAVTAPAYNELVAVFKNLADDSNGQEDGSGVTFSAISGSPALTAVTGMAIGGDLWTGFAADAWTGGGGTFGSYSTTASPQSSIALPLGWLVLLPSGSS